MGEGVHRMSILFVRHEEEITEGPATVSLPWKAGVGASDLGPRTSDFGRRTSDFGKIGHGSSLISRIGTLLCSCLIRVQSVAAAFSPSAHFSDHAGVVEGRPLEGRVFCATQAGL